MARNTSPNPQLANLSHQQMQESLVRIDRRLNEIAAFDPASISDRSDPSIRALENKLTTLLNFVFPPETIEHKQYRYQATKVDTAGINVNGTTISRVREGLESGKAQTAMAWTTIREAFVEELEDAGQGISQSGKSLRAYEGLELHPEIERACGDLFKNGHYANAIEDGVKALNALVRLRSGVESDGTKLMESVFGGSAILKFNELTDQSVDLLHKETADALHNRVICATTGAPTVDSEALQYLPANTCEPYCARPLFAG